MKQIMGIFTLLLGMFFFATEAQAGFGVSPSNIYHEYLKPGGHFEQNITLSRSDPEEELEVVVEPALEEMRDWFRFEPGLKFVFPKGKNRMTLKTIIDVPSDAPYKTYLGIIRVKAMTSGGVSGGVAIIKGARVDVELVTTKLNVTELEVKQMKMNDVVGGESLKLEIEATNRGNTEITPTAKLKIMNLQMQVLEELENTDFGVIEPNESKTMVAEFGSQLGIGEYFAEASVLSGEVVARRERLVFRIIDRPAIAEMIIKPEKWGKLTGWLSDTAWLLRVGVESGVAILVVLLVWYGKKWWRWLVGLVTAKRRRLLLQLISFLLLLGVLWVGARQVISLRRGQAVKEQAPASMTPRGEPGLQVTTGDGWVEGLATDGAEYVLTKEGEGSYALYSEPSLSSRIVYYAQEGEELTVIEERAEWFRVLLPDTTSGWLAKASVKRKTIESR